MSWRIADAALWSQEKSHERHVCAGNPGHKAPVKPASYRIRESTEVFHHFLSCLQQPL